jgi:tetratricopeptide (TPR) repeat protein
MTRLLTAALIALATAAAAGCQPSGAGSAAGAAPARRAVGVEQLRADGVAALEKGRYESALRAFGEALSRLPDDVGLHYLLAVTYSHLDRKDDAILAFRYVVQHGKPGSPEFEAATRWLAGAGVAAERAQAAAAPDPPEALTASLEGRLAWTEIEPDRVYPRIQLQLEGTGITTRGKRYGIFAHIGGQYAFPKVRPGDYRLRAQAGYARLWEMDVTVGEKTLLDLTPDNATSRDALKRPS